MKHRVLLAAFLLGSLQLIAQIPTPVKWTTSFEKIDAKTFDLKFAAKIQDGWFVYSNHIEEGGPIPTTIDFDAGSHFKVQGEIKEKSGHRKEGFDELFDMNVIKYSKEVTFIQRIVVSNASLPLTGYLTYQTCDDTQCLPPTPVNFSFDLAQAASASAKPGPGSPAPLSPAPAPATAEPAAAPAQSQAFRAVESPLEWRAELRPIAAAEFELSFHAKIDEGYYTYSQFLAADGPVPTSINFEQNQPVEKLGKAAETSPKMEKGYDANFDMDLIKLKKEASFIQKIRIADLSQSISGYVEFMACNDNHCLPPVEIPFEFNAQAMTIRVGNEQGGLLNPLAGEQALVPPGINPDGGADFQMTIKPDLANPIAACSETVTVKSGTSYWSIFALGFIGGLLALLTPCVFPMIPLTVSFFTKSSGNRRKGITNASLYGFFILGVYLLLSAPFHLMDSIHPGILNDISTNVWLNVAFFVIFLVFAFSFFGYYELTLPSSWANKAASAEGIGGILGIFFMALTLALVSFSCTGPILGSLLAGALTADGGAWQLTAGMGGFGLALALPFALFAAFPTWMNALPKSGGWLNTVKVTLGFLELALALKFLSNADMVQHWSFLKVELFLGLWLLIFLGLALYLFGLIRFPHDSPGEKRSPLRLGLGVVSLLFAVYLGSGFRYNEQLGTYQPLTLLSGLAPPVGYSFFHPSDCPQNLNCFKDLNEGLAYAREVNKPVMLDFTGYACVNCRKMEEHIWPVGQVYQQLKDDYVLISLYTDDKKELPLDQQKRLPDFYGSRDQVLRTYGHKWQYFQQTYFQAIAQPFYVLISPDGHLLNNPVGYTPDPAEYAQFLECGKDAYRQLVENQGVSRDKRIGQRE